MCALLILEDLIFVDHTLSAITAKFTSLENLYEYTVYRDFIDLQIYKDLQIFRDLAI